MKGLGLRVKNRGPCYSRGVAHFIPQIAAMSKEKPLPISAPKADRVDEDRTLYLQYRDEKNVQRGKSWQSVILEDFAELRKSGQTHSLMDEIETKFNAPG
jgi:hypothetical protein